MSNRKLVTLRKVKEIKPIVDADNIELARVDGWQCVVKKGEFEEGDIGLYFEVDSVLPEDERWSFLESSKWRIKTRRFRGALSQGLLLPIGIITETELQNIANLVDMNNINENDYVVALNKAQDNRVNLSRVFGVEKYEHPSEKENGSDTAGGFPGFLRKTDQERIQNLVDEYKDELRFHPYEITEKLEGTSITIYFNPFIDEFGVCSRNLRKKRSDYPIWDIVDKVGYEQKLKRYARPIALQGELIGPKIQKNVYGLDEHQFHIFDIWDIEKHQYMIPIKRLRVLTDLFGSEEVAQQHHVPILAYNSVGVQDDIEHLLEFAEGHSELNIDIDREGLVFKSMGDPNVSFKVINNEYLLNQ